MDASYPSQAGLRCPHRSVLLAAIIAAAAAQVASAAPFVAVLGGPKYVAGTGGYVSPGFVPDVVGTFEVTSGGNAITWSIAYNGAATARGDRGLYWNGTGAPPVELTPFGAYPDGITFTYADAINPAGTIVGSAYQFDASKQMIGRRAARWDSPTAAPIELGYLGPVGSFSSETLAINAAGAVVGYAAKVNPTLGWLGNRPVRWNPGSTTAIELGNLGTDPAGFTRGTAEAINAAGTIVGSVTKFVGGVDRGTRPVRWDAGTTTATELDVLGTDANGSATAYATRLNAAGTAIGAVFRVITTAENDERAVRWAATGTAVTELGVLGTNAAGMTTSRAHAINDAGTVVGYAHRYDAANHNLGKRAVRWDPTSADAVPLGDFGTGPGDIGDTVAYDIDAVGNIVGYARRFSGPVASQGYRAVYWPAGSTTPIDLNTLIDPAAGWTLTSACAISDDNNWVTGVGTFDPDGAGGQAAYSRPYLLQVPEPTAAATLPLLCAATTVVRRRRRN
jgi:uncharacterized membrane protein